MNAVCYNVLLYYSDNYVRDMLILCEKLHSFFCLLDKYFISGFLGQGPDDLRSKMYTFWLKCAGSKIGKNSFVHHSVKVWRPQNISIGENVRVPASTDMAGMGRITIGNNVLIGAHVSFITNDHNLEDSQMSWKNKMIGLQSDIVIQDYTWLMNCSMIIAGKNGITLGKCSWVGAGSVVTKNIPHHQLWGGCPAKFIRNLIDYHE